MDSELLLKFFWIFPSRHCRVRFYALFGQPLSKQLYLTVIPRARIGYEMIDTRLVGSNHLISNKRKWNNCFIKNNQEILLDPTDFAVQE